MNYAIGIDLGCSAVKALAANQEGRVLAQARFRIPGHQSPAWKTAVLRAVEQLIQDAKAVPEAIGVAAPGLTDREERAIVCMPGRLPGLEGFVWQDFLDVKYPVPVLNDAHAALAGETWLGAARGSRDAVLLTLGTGVGGAAMLDGRLLRGQLGRAGHFGHISLDPSGPKDVANTPGSLEYCIGDYSVAERSHGRFATTRELVAASRRGDREARRIWRQSVRALAAGIASLVNAFDPEVVLIGGGIAAAGTVLFRPLNHFLNEFEWRPTGKKVRLRRAKLGERAGAFGAAYYALRQARGQRRETERWEDRVARYPGSASRHRRSEPFVAPHPAVSGDVSQV